MKPDLEQLNPYYCSFCGTREEDAEFLIRGPLVNICGECVELCAEIIQNERNNRASALPGDNVPVGQGEE